MMTSTIAALGLTPVQIGSAAEALEEFELLAPSIAIIDYGLEDMPPVQLTRQLRAASVDLPLVALIPAGQIETAAEARRAGANHTVERSAGRDELTSLVGALVGRAKPSRPDDPERFRFFRTYRSLFRRGQKGLELESAVLRIAEAEGPVLVAGETGAGRKMVARAIHYLSPRSARRWTRVNGSAVPPHVIEAEIFGVSNGETGNAARSLGRIEEANGGTLVLEEFADLPFDIQAKLVQLLQERSIYRAGGQRAIEVDVRLIATTSKDVARLVRSGRLREDLYYRLNAMMVRVPPLRERPDEIPGLADYFRLEFMRESRGDRAPLSDELQDVLRAYDWPGNVLELENLMKRYVVLGDEQQLTQELRARTRNARARQRASGGDTGSESLQAIARRAAREAEIAAILDALEAVQWNRAEAARRLKVSYKTLLNKLARAGIVRPGREGFPSNG